MPLKNKGKETGPQTGMQNLGQLLGNCGVKTALEAYPEVARPYDTCWAYSLA